MPELPEVETMRRFLQSRVTGKRIVSATFERPEILKSSSPEEFNAAVSGCRIAGTGRRGKYLSLHLQAADAAPELGPAYELVIHLKMRGDLRVEPENVTPDRYLCAELHLESEQALRFYDIWRWGAWNLFPAGKVEIPGLSAMGLEPFDPAFTTAYLAAKLAKRSGPLKTTLLDQALLAGLGNIYADESLHLARLHPSRPAKSLSSDEIERLHAAIGEVLNRAVSQGGAYADRQAQQEANIEGFESIYTPRIYDRPGQPCPVCGEPLVKFQLRGRGATFCPMCQPDANIPAG